LISTTRDLDHEHQQLSAVVTARDVDLTVTLIGTHVFSTAPNMLSLAGGRLISTQQHDS
jgi:hypothetical protein